MLSVLVVAPDFPYPATHGGRVDVFRRLELLSKMDCEVDFLVTVKSMPSKSEQDVVAGLVNKQIIIFRKEGLRNLFSIKPYQITSRKELQNIKLTKKYDWVFIEGDYVGSILDNKTLEFQRIFIRINNNESRYFYKLAQAVFPKPNAMYYLLDSIKFHFFSKNLYKKADLLGFVSSEELRNFEDKNHNINNKKIQLLCHYDVNKFKKAFYYATDHVLFIGSLFMPNNINGLYWYLKNVHPILIQQLPTYKLIIVGSTGRNIQLQKKLKAKVDKLEKVDLNFDVEDLNCFYNKARVFINPMFKGAGIKVKTLQAMQNGLPVVSTQVGAEGLDLINCKHAFITDNYHTFSDKIVELMKNPNLGAEMVDAAQEHLKKIDATTIFNEFIFS